MEIERITKEALDIVTPSREEEDRVISTANSVINIFNNGLIRRGYKDFEVSLQGSVAKGTWLPGDRDIDIFVILSRIYLNKIKNGDVVNDLIDVARENNLKWIIKYAQHPYIQVLINDFEIDVVPCIKISQDERPFTAADRTPLHTEFVKSKLGGRNTDVRLLKAFFKTIGIYGAEIKVQGFSGYVSELLVIYYGSFIDVIKAMAKWSTKRVFIDMTNTYDEKNAFKKFRAPVIIIDPVDPNRNAAASVSRENLATAIAASREFLEHPRLEFFKRIHRSYPMPQVVIPSIVLRIGYPINVSPDIVWGEIRRLMDSLTRNLEKYEFRVIRSMAWSDDKSVILLMLSLREARLPPYENHKGPLVDSDAARNFIKKYINDQNVVGPFIRGSRWYVIKKRRFVNAIDLIKYLISTISLKNLRSYVNEAEFFVIESIEDLRVFNTNERNVIEEFLYARPWWLV